MESNRRATVNPTVKISHRILTQLFLIVSLRTIRDATNISRLFTALNLVVYLVNIVTVRHNNVSFNENFFTQTRNVHVHCAQRECIIRRVQLYIGNLYTLTEESWYSMAVNNKLLLFVIFISDVNKLIRFIPIIISRQLISAFVWFSWQ